MALTAAEVLELFDQVAAIKNSDQILMIKANQNGTVSASKITAETLKAYLDSGHEITIGNDGYFYIGGVKTNVEVQGIPIIQHTFDTMVTIEPNKLHIWGAVSSLTLGFADGPLGQVAEYMFQFSSPANSAAALTLPNGVKWMNGDNLEPEPNWTYQVSIVNNLAVYSGWENS